MNDVEKAPLLERLWADIRKHRLERYVAELDVLGYTIVPPEVAAPPGFTDRLREACLDVAERRHGTRPNVQTGSTYPGFGRVGAQTPGVKDSPFGDLMRCLLLEGRIFEEALMQPVLLTLATHLCGFNVTLSLMSCLIKGPNESALALHTDTNLPTPLPPYAVVMNNTWILTDYNRENGATAMIPGSHKWYRNPPEPRAGIASKETDPRENPKAIVVEAKAGSLLVWHGNMWHGAFNRTAPGLRVSLQTYMARQAFRTQEDLIERVPQEILDRNPPRFATLTQQGVHFGCTSDQDSEERMARVQKQAGPYLAELGREVTDRGNPLAN